MQPHRTEIEHLWHAVNTYCQGIEESVKGFVRLIQQQRETLLQSDGGLGGDLSGRSPLSAVPSSVSTQLPTLLFTNETKQVFLRSALTRELFQNLKRISKRWLANIPEDQRRQATKVAQAIAKAVTDYRVNCITEKDLATYKTHIQQSFGREYHIPLEQIRHAFSQKIRVYLQNTKSEHDEWVEKYGGKVDINAPVIVIDDDDENEDGDSIAESPSQPPTSTLAAKPIIGGEDYNSFPPLREDTGEGNNDMMHLLPFKRSHSVIDETESPKKRMRETPTSHGLPFESQSDYLRANLFSHNDDPLHEDGPPN